MNSAKAAISRTMTRFLRALSENCLAYVPSSSTATPSLTWWLANPGHPSALFQLLTDSLHICHLYSICEEAWWKRASCKIKTFPAILETTADRSRTSHCPSCGVVMP